MSLLHSLHTVSFATAVAFSMAAPGAAQLKLDGILLVTGMTREGARVIVVSENGASEVLTEGLAHFTLNLDLQTEYLISFERPGCVSKELHFSTKVPAGHRMEKSYFFPFQVTLAPPSSGRHYAYAGPVGFIHFDKDIDAFGYDTDYRLAKEETLSKRLDLIRTSLDPAPIPIASPAGMPMKLTAAIPDWIVELSEKISAQDHSGTLAPTVSQVAPMVHVIEVPIAEKEALDEPARPIAADPIDHTEPVDEIQFRTELPPPAPIYAMAPPPTGGHYSTEVEADGLRVITTTTVKRGVEQEEYRRVVSYYGGVTYFCNGRPCSETTYNQGLAR